MEAKNKGQGQAASDESTALAGVRDKKLEKHLEWLRESRPGQKHCSQRPEQLSLDFFLLASRKAARFT